MKREDVTPEGFGRIAAQTAKQVILQRIREEERRMMYDEYIDRVTEVVTGIVQQAGDRNNVLVDLGKVEALLPRSEQVDGERYEQGSRIKAVITEVRSGTKGPQVILSRRDPELIKTLFELEVPEIADGLVEIRGVAREPGYRSKIAVESHAQGVDPVGACVGPRGSRVRMVVSELRGEKIDIIPWNPEPARFVAKALSPARVREVYLDDEAREATVVTPDDQLALAIGKEGMNARLAARLTGWKIDIQSDTEFAQAEAEAAFGGGSGEGARGLLRPLRRDPRQRQALPERRSSRAPASAASRRTRRSRAPAATTSAARLLRGWKRRRRGRRGRGQKRPTTRPRRFRLRKPSSRRSSSKPRSQSRRRSRRESRSSRPPRRSLRRRRRSGVAPAAAGVRRSVSLCVSRPTTACSWPAAPSPAEARTPAARSRASSERPSAANSHASCGSPCESSLSCVAFTLERHMANGGNRPNRPLRPRGGGAGGGRRRRVVIDQGERAPRASSGRRARTVGLASHAHPRRRRPVPSRSSRASAFATSRRRSASRCRTSSRSSWGSVRCGLRPSR